MSSIARADRSIGRLHFSSRHGFAAVTVLAAIGLASLPAAAALRWSDRAVAELNRLDSDAFTLQASLRVARANRDTSRVGCVDEALTRVHVAARRARALTDAITAEERAGDGLGVTRDWTRLSHLATRTREVVAEARRCGLPEGAVANEKTVVTVHVPPLPPGGGFPDPPSKHAP
jgi:hypothetical protein